MKSPSFLTWDWGVRSNTRPNVSRLMRWNVPCTKGVSLMNSMFSIISVVSCDSLRIEFMKPIGTFRNELRVKVVIEAWHQKGVILFWRHSIRTRRQSSRWSCPSKLKWSACKPVNKEIVELSSANLQMAGTSKPTVAGDIPEEDSSNMEFYGRRAMQNCAESVPILWPGSSKVDGAEYVWLRRVEEATTGQGNKGE